MGLWFPLLCCKNCAQWASHHRDWWSSRPVLTSTPSSVSMSGSITFNSLILESIFIYYGPSVLPCDPRCHFTVNWFQLVLHNMTYHMSNWIPALSPVLQFNYKKRAPLIGRKPNLDSMGTSADVWRCMSSDQFKCVGFASFFRLQFDFNRGLKSKCMRLKEKKRGNIPAIQSSFVTQNISCCHDYM